MKRLLAVVAIGLTPLVTAGAGRAADECDGLDVCISVPGPWVAVPAAGARAQTVYFQLTCPRRSIVGGLDAVLGARGLDVQFLGLLGSPVNPGITTGRSAVFVATWARGSPTSFRPFLGCIPTGGGGGGGTFHLASAAVTPVATPSATPVRRVRTLRVRTGRTSRLAFGCLRGERLVGSSHAVAFHTGSRKPEQPVLNGAGALRRERGGRVDVSARRRSAVPARVRVDVQVHALCVRRAR